MVKRDSEVVSALFHHGLDSSDLLPQVVKVGDEGVIVSVDHGEPADVFFLDFVRNPVLESRVLGGILFGNDVHVKQVVPKVVLLKDVLVEVLEILFERGSVNPANEASVLFVLLDFLPLVPQLYRFKCV